MEEGYVIQEGILEKMNQYHWDKEGLDTMIQYQIYMQKLCMNKKYKRKN